MREERDHWKSEHYRVHCLNQVMLTHDQANELLAALPAPQEKPK